MNSTLFLTHTLKQLKGMEPKMLKETVSTFDVYKLMAEKYSVCFTYTDVRKELKLSIYEAGSRVGNYLNKMQKYGLVVKKNKKYYPQYFKCSTKCKVALMELATVRLKLLALKTSELGDNMELIG